MSYQQSKQTKTKDGRTCKYLFDWNVSFESKFSLNSFFPIICFCELWCVGGGGELEDLGYIEIEPIQPNRGTPSATKLVNFNISSIIINPNI